MVGLNLITSQAQDSYSQSLYILRYATQSMDNILDSYGLGLRTSTLLSAIVY